MKQKTAIVYLRVSRKEQAKGFSLGDQVKACHLYAEQQGLRIVGNMWVSRVNGLPTRREDPNAILGYCDPGVSGTLRNRPALNTAISFLEDCHYDYVLAQDTDRFSRDPEVFYHIAHDMKRSNPDIGFGFVTGIAQGMNPDVLLLSMALGMAKKEIDKTKQRSVTRKAEKARRGLFGEGNGVRPFGYRVDLKHPNNIGGLVIVSEEAVIVCHIYTLYDSGYSLSKISQWLYEHNILTHRGKEQWSPQVIRRILTQTTYKGIHVSHINGETIDKLCPKIVDEELWERVNQKRDYSRRYNRTRQSTGREYFMGEGRLRCADCNGSYGAELQPKGKRNRVTDFLMYRHRVRSNDPYGYQGCRNDHIHSKYVEPAVWDEIRTVLATPERIKESYAAYIDQIKAENSDLVRLQTSYSQELVDIQSRLANLIRGFEAGAITVDELKERREEYDERIAHLRLELQRVNSQIGYEPNESTVEALEAFTARISELLETAEFDKNVRIEILRLLNVKVYIRPKITEEGKIWEAKIMGHFPARELSLGQRP